MDRDTIISFADVVVEDKIIEMIANDRNNFSLLIDTSKLRDGTMFVANKDNLLKSITSTDKKEATGNFIGISKIKKIFLKDFISAMSEIINESNNYYYTMALNNMIKKKLKINTIDVSGKFWTEVDENSDYKKLLLEEKIFYNVIQVKSRYINFFKKKLKILKYLKYFLSKRLIGKKKKFYLEKIYSTFKKKYSN